MGGVQGGLVPASFYSREFIQQLGFPDPRATHAPPKMSHEKNSCKRKAAKGQQAQTLVSYKTSVSYETSV